jgi:hypothetical protein
LDTDSKHNIIDNEIIKGCLYKLGHEGIILFTGGSGCSAFQPVPPVGAGGEKAIFPCQEHDEMEE